MKNYIISLIVTVLFITISMLIFKYFGVQYGKISFILGWWSCVVFNYSLKHLENEK